MKKSFLILECFLSIFLVSLFISCKTDVNIPEKKVELVKLIPSETNLTKESYYVNVDISKFQNMKAIKWAEGKKDTQYFIDGGGEEISTEKKFSVAKNGEYTVFVTDGEKNNVISIISIDNIDMTPPKSVQNLVGEYNKDEKTITLSWDNPTDSDYKELKILKDGECISLSKEIKTYSFSNIESDKKNYNFEVITLDNLGNASAPVTVRVRAGFGFHAIKLSRNDIMFNDPTLKIKVDLEIDNIDCIDIDINRVNVRIFTESNQQYGGLYNVSMDSNKGVATTTITAPKIELHEVPVNYKVKVFIDDNEYPIEGADFTISRGPTNPTDKLINDFNYCSYDINMVMDSTVVNFSFTAENLDLVNNVTVAFWDQNHNIVGDHIEVLEKIKEKNTYKVKMPVPKKEGMYIPKIFFYGVNQNPYKPVYDNGVHPRPDGTKLFFGEPELRVYGTPEFTNLYIPKLGINNSSNDPDASNKDFFWIEITGKNFGPVNDIKIKINNEVCNNIFCDAISGTKIKIRVPRPTDAGETPIEILYKKNRVLKGNIITKDYSEYPIGTLIKQNSKNIGVVAGYNEYGAPFIIGTDISKELSFAKEGTIGEKYYIEDNFYTYTDKLGSSYSELQKDMFGKDNWDNICAIDPEGTKSAEKNYPAFYWANNYGITNEMEGSYRTGWYMPSINELKIIHNNFKAVEKTFQEKLDNWGLSSLYITSSSQYEFDETSFDNPAKDLSNYVWKYAIFADGIDKIEKKAVNNVICIHELEL